MENKTYYGIKNKVSNTSFKYLIQHPSKFKDFLEGQIEEKEKSYLEFGKLVHLYLLERDVFDEMVEVFDCDVPSSAQQKLFFEKYLEVYEGKNEDNTLIEAYKASYKVGSKKDETILETAKTLMLAYPDYIEYIKKSKEKKLISSLTFDKIREINNAVTLHKAGDLLLFGHADSFIADSCKVYNEKALYTNIKGVECKGMLDRLIIDEARKKAIIVDVKTSSSFSPFEESFEAYDYARQLEFYRLLLIESEEFPVEDDWTIEMKIVALSTVRYDCEVYNYTTRWEVRDSIYKLLNRAKWHIENDKWEHKMEYYLGNGEFEI